MPYAHPDFDEALLNFRLILKLRALVGSGPGVSSLLPVSAALLMSNKSFDVYLSVKC